MEGKTVLVTGANSGVGKETARVLARAGARAVLVCRNPERGEAAAEEIRETARGPVEVLLADLGSLRSVRDAAAVALETYPRIDVLINNAGVYRLRRHLTDDGIEEVIGVNHLGPFLLTNLLVDRLRAGAPSRVVMVASEAHRSARLDLDDLQLERRYGSWRAYCNSKLSNVMFTYALARRLEGSGVTVNAAHPGFVRTSLGRGNGIPVRPVYWLLRPFTISPQRGAETPVHLASAAEVDGVTGSYFSDRREIPSSAVSYDENAQERLWELSARLVGLAAQV